MKNNHKDIEYVLTYYSVQYKIEEFHYKNFTMIKLNNDYLFYCPVWENNGSTTLNLLNRFKYCIGSTYDY